MSTRISRSAAAALFVLVAAAPVRAQQPDTTRLYHLDALVVTAERRAAPIEASTHAVSLLTAAELRALPVRTLAEALRQAPGLTFVDFDGLGNNTADPSVTLQYGGRTCMAFGALYGGGADGGAFTPNGDCTTVHDHDLGAFYGEVIRQTTAGSSDFAIGGSASNDDVAFAVLAVSEVVITGGGDLAAGASSASGEGTSSSTGSGSLAAGAASLSGEGEVRRPVATQVAATVANIVLDPIFIFGLDWGVAGAAVATAIAQAGAAVALGWLLFTRGRNVVRLGLRRFPVRWEPIAGIGRIGIPASLSFVVMSVGGGVFNRAEGLAEEIGADIWARDPEELISVMDRQRERRMSDDQRTVGRKRKIKAVAAA